MPACCMRVHHERGQGGYSIIELLLVLGLVAVLTAIVVPQLMSAWDRARQRASMADMRSIASANGVYRVDYSTYAPDLDALMPYYMEPVPPTDAWNTVWVYESTGRDYLLSSLGTDGAPGPAAPSPWYDQPFEADLVVQNGAFTQAPDVR